jgi:hypothetical protein
VAERVPPTTTPTRERLVIRTRIVIADMERAETIATGVVLEGSTLGDSEFCIGGTILDAHGSPDPAVALIARTVSCPEGTVEMRLRPVVGEEPQGRTQTGSWKIGRGTGAFERLRGNGKLEVVYGPTEDAPVRETLTGTVTRWSSSGRARSSPARRRRARASRKRHPDGTWRSDGRASSWLP